MSSSTALATTTETALAPHERASFQLAQTLGIDAGQMVRTIKAQCFRNMNPDAVSNEQLAAFVQIANSLSLNPLLPGMLYAYPERNNGITPIIGPDGIFTLLSNHSDIEGWKTKHGVDEGGDKICTAIIKHKRLGEMEKTVWLSEWRVGNNPNWQTRPRHMLEIRALKQCARQIIHGVPMDEEERVIGDMKIAQPLSESSTVAVDAPSGEPTVGTPAAETKRAAVPTRKPRGAAAVVAPTSPPVTVESATATSAPAKEAVIDVSTQSAPVVPVAVEPTAPAPVVPTKPTVEEFMASLANLDWTYDMSDDPAVYGRGRDKYLEAQNHARSLGVEYVKAFDDRSKAALGEPTQPEPTSLVAAAPEPAPTVVVEPVPEAGYTPRYPQPEGFPKKVETFFCSVMERVADYTLRDGTKVTKGPLKLVTLAGESITRDAVIGRDGKGAPIARVAIDPENLDLVAVSKVSQTPMLLTVELWPSQGDPAVKVPVATQFCDITVI